MATVKPICSVEKCDTRSIAKGLCTKHYKRVAKYGDPHYAKKQPLPIPALKSCKTCNEVMPIKVSAYEYNHRKFCSNECMVASLRKPTQYLDCPQCGEQVERSCGTSGGYVTKQKYCTKKCADDSQRTDFHIDQHGYRILHIAERGDVPEHRFVMEKVIGRLLTKEETVHHKNGKRSDNRPANLELWSSRHGKGQRVEDKLKWCAEFINQYSEIAENLGIRLEEKKSAEILSISDAISGLMSLAA